MRRFASAAVAVAMLAGLPAAARAHAFLDQAVPAVGGTVATAPAEIRLKFSEPIEPRFSRITLTTGNGSPVVTAAAATDPADPKQFVLRLPPLAPGTYKVLWRVVSVDTHTTVGDYTFEIKP